jgi:hypothetical protein
MITMKAKTTLFLGTLGFALLTANAGAQSAVSTESTGDKKHVAMDMAASVDGIEVKITTLVVYPDGTEPDNVRGGIQARSKFFRRTTEVRGTTPDVVCYGYDLGVEPLPDPDHPRFRVTFQPISDDKWQRTEKSNGCTTVASLPGLPAPQTVAKEDIITLEILSNPQTGAKIIDRIEVRPAK